MAILHFPIILDITMFIKFVLGVNYYSTKEPNESYFLFS